MSSSVASAGEHTAQQNFNPSWMRSTFHGGGGGVGSTPRASVTDDVQDDYPLSEPILSDFRYGREHLLALAPRDSNPPDGLEDCPFFVEIAQNPVAPNELNDQELRLQHNINSSKAMSSLSHAERASIAAGAAYGGGYSTNNIHSPNSSVNRTPGGGGWTTQRQTSWSKSNTPERSQRGGASVRGSGGFYSRGGGRTPQENGGGTVNGATSDDSYAKFSALRRGGGPAAVGRGGSTSGTPYNARAEQLYSKDERPRGIGVSRSESDEETDDQGGWSTVGAKNNQAAEKVRPAWGRSESWSTRNNDTSNIGGAWNRNEKSNGAVRENTNVWKDRQQMLDSLQDAPNENNLNTAKSTSDSNAPDSNTSLQKQMSDSAATTSDSFASQTQEPVQSQQNQQQFPAVWQNSVITGLPSLFEIERLRLVQLQQQQQLAAQIAAQQQAAAVAAAQAQAAAAQQPKEPVQFYYLDPSETVRGPFSKEQMVAWFKAGYFSDESLRIKRGEDGKYQTIGQLSAQNGKTTPFDYVEDNEKLRTSPTSLSQYGIAPQLVNQPGFGNFGSSNMWGGNIDVFVQSTVEKQVAAERMKIADEFTRRAVEESENIKKMQEAMIRQMHIQRELTNQQIREQEIALQRQQEELQRREAEIKERALELTKKFEEHQNQLSEKERAINAELSRKAAEDKMRKEREELLAQKLMEEENRRKKAELAAEMEKQRLARESELAAERIRQLNIQKKAESEALNRKKKEEEDRRIAEELSQKKFEIEQSYEKASKPKQVSPTASDDSESGWTSVAKTHTKPAPWAAAKPETAKEKTLREIQLEEERQAKIEAERLAKLKKEEQKEQMSLQAAGTWGNASARLQWAGNSNGSPSSKSKNNAAPVWGSAQESPRSYVSPLLDGPSLEAANKIQPAKKVQPVAAAKPVAAVAPPKKATVAPTPKPVVEQKSKQQQASEQMSNWFSKRFKQLSNNSDEVDTSMLFTCVMDLENPNEVEDIVMSYLDENKSVKEFVREFLKRRIELRANNNKTNDHDDLSSARAVSAAPSDSNNGSNGNNAGVQGKKKKKNQRMVLDGNILGFRGAAASDRLNKGEIDAVPTAPVNPSRR